MELLAAVLVTVETDAIGSLLAPVARADLGATGPRRGCPEGGGELTAAVDIALDQGVQGSLGDIVGSAARWRVVDAAAGVSVVGRDLTLSLWQRGGRRE